MSVRASLLCSMQRLLALLVLLPAFAFAQERGKPSPEPYLRRADTFIVDRDSCKAGDFQTARHSVVVGDSEAAVVEHEIPEPAPAEAGGGSLNALVLHDDENTAVEAALEVICERGGRLVELAHSGERNISFEVNGEEFVADPNRMFTDAGRWRTLDRLSRDTPEAREALASLADSVQTIYGVPRVVVTLHNNTPDNYSAESYLPGHEYADDAETVFVAPEQRLDPDDFFFVTDRQLFEAIEQYPYSAVLQDNTAATDDGSLSVWAGQNGIPYVNVEAQHGHLDEQVVMIKVLLDVLERR